MNNLLEIFMRHKAMYILSYGIIAISYAYNIISVKFIINWMIFSTFSNKMSINKYDVYIILCE